MKTLEQVKKHVEETCYSEEECGKIFGFLIGRFPNQEFDVDFANPNSFQDFLEWFEDESKDEPQQCTSTISMFSKNIDMLKEILEKPKPKKMKIAGSERFALNRIKNELLSFSDSSSVKHLDSIIAELDKMLNETVD